MRDDPGDGNGGMICSVPAHSITPEPDMSLKNSANLSREQCDAILAEEDTCCLALCHDGEPYVVPVSYLFWENVLVIHCATVGKKLDILRANPRVGFTVFRHPDRIRPHPEGTCTYRFESVIGTGNARIIDDTGERMTWLTRFLSHFEKKLGLPEGGRPVTSKAAENCACFLVEIETLTGRKKG